MSRQSKLVLAVALALIGLAAVVLARLQSWQTLGEPGLRLVMRNVYSEDGKVLGTNTVPLPEKILEFESRELPISTNVAFWLPPDTTYAQRLYQDTNGFGALLNVVLMGRDRTSIHKPEYCLPGQGFQIQKTERCTIPIQEPHSYELPVTKMTAVKEVMTTRGQKVQARAIYVFWFVADGELTADHGDRMRSMARSLITDGVLQRWAYVACFAMCLPGEEGAAYARMEKLIAAAVPRFQLATGPATIAARK
jgi:hypothetical protein